MGNATLLAPPILLLAAALATAGPASAHEHTLKVEIHGSHRDANVTFTLGSDTLLGTLESLAPKWLHCNSTSNDADVVAAIDALDHAGDGATYSHSNHDKKVWARRAHDQLTLVVEDPGEGHVELSMPWNFAECIRGQSVTVGDLLDGVKNGEPVEIRVKGRDGSTVRLTID